MLVSKGVELRSIIRTSIGACIFISNDTESNIIADDSIWNVLAMYDNWNDIYNFCIVDSGELIRNTTPEIIMQFRSSFVKSIDPILYIVPQGINKVTERKMGVNKILIQVNTFVVI